MKKSNQMALMSTQEKMNDAEMLLNSEMMDAVVGAKCSSCSDKCQTCRSGCSSSQQRTVTTGDIGKKLQSN